MTAATPTLTLLRLITADDQIRCTRCPAEVPISESKCRGGRRVCEPCYGPDPEAEGVAFLHLITTDDVISCTLCGGEIVLTDSKCIEGHRVCGTCFGPDPVSELEPPF
jgi:formylmethanofuran dehydrogenase subunit E